MKKLLLFQLILTFLLGISTKLHDLFRLKLDSTPVGI